MKHFTLPRRVALPATAGLVLAISSAAAVGAATSEVAARDFAFMPGSTTVAVGDSVSWTNHDPVEHNVHFVSGPAGPLIGQGQTYSRTFTEPGRYAYFCDPHPSMTGEVVVAAPADEGGDGGAPTPTPSDTTPNTATETAPTDDSPASLLLLVGAAAGLVAGFSVSRRAATR